MKHFIFTFDKTEQFFKPETVEKLHRIERENKITAKTIGAAKAKVTKLLAKLNMRPDTGWHKNHWRRTGGSYRTFFSIPLWAYIEIELKELE